MGGDAALYRLGQKPVRRGLVHDKWPFRLDISVEYQDWILVGMCLFLVALWTMPCCCSRLQGSIAKAFTNWVYTRMHVFYCGIVYITLITIFFTLAVLPDWTLDDFIMHVAGFLIYTLEHLENLVISIFIIIAFWVFWKMRGRVALAAGYDHVTLVRWNWRDWFSFGLKKRPVEIFIWKMEEVKSATRKVAKANDLYIECHMGHNTPMRTRVHNNAGQGCMVKESFQINIDESDPNDLMTLLVCDQGIMGSSEVARLTLSCREICGIEDQTGKRRVEFIYSEESFVALSLIPQGKIWIAIAPVDDHEVEELRPLMDEDAVTC